jgi:hypothetical protein
MVLRVPTTYTCLAVFKGPVTSKCHFINNIIASAAMLPNAASDLLKKASVVQV